MRSRLARAIKKFPLHIVVITITFLWLLPSVAIFINSFRQPTAIRSTGWWHIFINPFDFTQYTIMNYVNVLEAQNLARSFRNSLIITIPATILPGLIASFAAYAFAWMKFPGRKILFSLVVGLLVVPLQMTFVPIFSVFTAWGINGTFLAIWLAHTGYGLPLAVYLIRNFMGALPKDLFETAYLSGASSFQAFWFIAIPLSMPVLASLAIFQFLWVWNDLLVALIFLGGTPRVAPLTVRVANLVDSLGASWYLLPAAAIVSLFLPMIVFFALQRYFVRGLLAGSVKGG
jgi:alpha-glucoside transport system permease protein